MLSSYSPTSFNCIIETVGHTNADMVSSIFCPTPRRPTPHLKPSKRKIWTEFKDEDVCQELQEILYSTLPEIVYSTYQQNSLPHDTRDSSDDNFEEFIEESDLSQPVSFDDGFKFSDSSEIGGGGDRNRITLTGGDCDPLGDPSSDTSGGDGGDRNRITLTGVDCDPLGDPSSDTCGSAPDKLFDRLTMGQSDLLKSFGYSPVLHSPPIRYTTQRDSPAIDITSKINASPIDQPPTAVKEATLKSDSIMLESRQQLSRSDFSAHPVRPQRVKKANLRSKFGHSFNASYSTSSSPALQHPTMTMRFEKMIELPQRTHNPLPLNSAFHYKAARPISPELSIKELMDDEDLNQLLSQWL